MLPAENVHLDKEYIDILHSFKKLVIVNGTKKPWFNVGDGYPDTCIWNSDYG